MSATQIRAGQAYVELYGDRKRLTKDLKTSEGEVKTWAQSVGDIASRMYRRVADAAESARQAAFNAGQTLIKIGGGISAVGAAIKAPLAAALKQFTDMGAAAYDQAQQTGLTVEALSTLSFAAEQTGASIGDVTAAIGKLQGENKTDQFRVIVDQLSRIPDAAQRAAAAEAYFGDAAKGILPILAAGAGEMAYMEERARKLGLQLKSSDTEAAHQLKLALSELWQVVKMVSYTLGAPLAEGMTKMVKLTTPLVAKVVNWLDANRDLILSADSLAGVLTTVGGVIAGAGAVLSGAAAAAGYFGTVVAAIVSPIGLAVAAIGGLGYWTLFHTEAGGKAIDWLVEKFQALKADVETAIGGVTDALQAGDMKLAIEVAWAAIKLEWAKGTTFLKQNWEEFGPWIINTAIDIAAGIAKAFSDGFAQIRNLWRDTIDWLAKQVLKANSFLMQYGVQVPWGQDISKFAIDQKNNGADQAARDRNQKIDGFADELRKKFGGPGKPIPDTITEAQRELDELRERARQAREDAEKRPGPAGTPGSLPTPAIKVAAAGQRINSGLGFEDVRTAAGFKPIADALAGRNGGDPTKDTANLQKLATNSDQMRRDARDTRDALANLTGENFKV